MTTNTATIAEIRLEQTPEVILHLGRRQWTHEATRKSDGARLYTSVVYNHSPRGQWRGVLVYPDGGTGKE